jgi:hypothetical protein
VSTTIGVESLSHEAMANIATSKTRRRSTVIVEVSIPQSSHYRSISR